MDNLIIYASIEYAEDDTRQSPGRVFGILVTYGEQAKDRPDVYDVDSLEWEDAGVILNEMHNRQSPIKRFTPYRDGASLRINMSLPPTARGRDAATMLRDKTFTGLSIEVERSSIVATYIAGVRHISRGKLMAAALVDKAAFVGSVVDVHAKRERNQLGALAWL